MTTVKDFQESRLYRLAFKRLVMKDKVKYHYISKTFKIVEEDFLEILLQGYEILNEATLRQIKI